MTLAVSHRSPAQCIFGLFGAGGFSREVMPFAAPYFNRMMQAQGATSSQVYFVDAHPQASSLNGVPLVSEEEFFSIECEKRYFNISAADSKLREKLAQLCIDRKAEPLTVHAANTTVYVQNQIGPGAIFCGYTSVTSNAVIGRFFHSNIYSYVAHDCVIGDFVTFAPRVHCNGNVHIGDHAYIGTGAVVKQGAPGKPLVIGAGAIVGMGAVVTKDVAPHTTVLGNPARPRE
ncbi:acetyltransferase [Comamonadaceae bacterium G21597-S1]|nr:acetyltransferase [Comamonadaceae bacterium G21597-S1]